MTLLKKEYITWHFSTNLLDIYTIQTLRIYTNEDSSFFCCSLKFQNANGYFKNHCKIVFYLAKFIPTCTLTFCDFVFFLSFCRFFISPTISTSQEV